MKILMREKEAEKNKTASDEQLWNFREVKKKKEENVKFKNLVEEQELVEIGEEGFDDLEVGDLMSELGINSTSDEIEVEFEEMLGDELDFSEFEFDEDSSLPSSNLDEEQDDQEEDEDMDSEDIINNFLSMVEDENEKREKEKELYKKKKKKKMYKKIQFKSQKKKNLSDTGKEKKKKNKKRKEKNKK